MKRKTLSMLFFAERDKKEALAKRQTEIETACKGLPHWSEMLGRYGKNPDTWLATEQDKEFQDANLFAKMMDEVSVCWNKTHLPMHLSDGEIEASNVEGNFMWMRIAYLQNRQDHTEAQTRGLVAKYNDLVASYNELVSLATVALLRPKPTAPSSYTWLKPTTPISGPVVCRGNTTALGQGMTNIYVSCN
jgi:hypothetical protein